MVEAFAAHEAATADARKTSHRAPALGVPFI